MPCVLCSPTLALCLNTSLLCSQAQCTSTLICVTSSVPSFGISSPLFSRCPHHTLPGCRHGGISPLDCEQAEKPVPARTCSVFSALSSLPCHHPVSRARLASLETVPPTATPSLASGRAPCPASCPRSPLTALWAVPCTTPGATHADMGVLPALCPALACRCSAPFKDFS